MARYIVLEVTDNTVAETLLEVFNEKTKQGWPARVVGLFVKPGRTCSCWNSKHSNYRADAQKHGFSGGVERGEKFGWWVCTKCNKPRKAGHSLVNQLDMNEIWSELKPLDVEWEFSATGLDITSIHETQVDRPKRLRKRKK